MGIGRNRSRLLINGSDVGTRSDMGFSMLWCLLMRYRDNGSKLRMYRSILLFEGGGRNSKSGVTSSIILRIIVIDICKKSG